MPQKKLYCRSFCRLARPREAKGENNIQLRCPRCNGIIYTWNGLCWR